MDKSASKARYLGFGPAADDFADGREVADGEDRP
jgi:hypothetical protein